MVDMHLPTPPLMASPCVPLRAGTSSVTRSRRSTTRSWGRGRQRHCRRRRPHVQDPQLGPLGMAHPQLRHPGPSRWLRPHAPARRHLRCAPHHVLPEVHRQCIGSAAYIHPIIVLNAVSPCRPNAPGRIRLLLPFPVSPGKLHEGVSTILSATEICVYQSGNLQLVLMESRCAIINIHISIHSGSIVRQH